MGGADNDLDIGENSFPNSELRHDDADEVPRAGSPSSLGFARVPPRLQELPNARVIEERQIASARRTLEHEIRELDHLRERNSRILGLLGEGRWIMDVRNKQQAEIDCRLAVLEAKAAVLQEKMVDGYDDLSAAKELYGGGLEPAERAQYFLEEWQRLRRALFEVQKSRLEREG
ncbi:hypothetical protein LTR37_003334 [Vermiconidia calcicola]|uniref:Uncharacterized protein n=1 Tax=Vermiconidia calcicola TaxID=1690605 RepID=A0ACC3NQI3_9PEZI|nr:hypothetical protein LTR37_003334 [Vermiconidia calcicola]